MINASDYVRARLFELRDEQYSLFTSKLIPNIPCEAVIGVRSPELKKLAKELKNTDIAAEFIKILPHKYLEEYNLHSLLIADIKDFETSVAETERLLPFVDNWATCDSLRPAAFKKHKKELFPFILKWLKSDKPYTVRFAISMLMCHFLDEDFEQSQLQLVALVKSEEYYVNMMRAWYFATALAKQYESTLPLIESQTLDKFTQNKSIQKAVESFRVSSEHKARLKLFKIK